MGAGAGMTDNVDMFSLLSVMAGLVAFDALAVRFGADSRRDDGPKF